MKSRFLQFRRSPASFSLAAASTWPCGRTPPWISQRCLGSQNLRDRTGSQARRAGIPGAPIPVPPRGVTHSTLLWSALGQDALGSCSVGLGHRPVLRAAHPVPTSFLAGSTPCGRSSTAWCISLSRGRLPLAVELLPLLVGFGLGLSPSSPRSGSNPFSGRSWDTLRASSVKWPALLSLGRGVSWKLWTSCPERSLGVRKMEDRLPPKITLNP